MFSSNTSNLSQFRGRQYDEIVMGYNCGQFSAAYLPTRCLVIGVSRSHCSRDSTLWRQFSLLTSNVVPCSQAGKPKMVCDVHGNRPIMEDFLPHNSHLSLLQLTAQTTSCSRSLLHQPKQFVQVTEPLHLADLVKRRG